MRITDVTRELENWAEQIEERISELEGRGFDDQIQEEIGSHDFTDSINEALGSFDFSDAIDFDREINRVLEHHDFSDEIRVAARDTLDELVQARIHEALSGSELDMRVEAIMIRVVEGLVPTLAEKVAKHLPEQQAQAERKAALQAQAAALQAQAQELLAQAAELLKAAA